MIGIIAKESEFEVIEEFFQLFKTPWEFYKYKKEYDVVIMSRDKMIDKIKAKVLLIFGSKNTQFDIDKNISLNTSASINNLKLGEIDLPLYTPVSTFKNVSKGEIFFEVNSEAIVFRIQEYNQTILRIGYNLFEEVKYLLSEGQPIENASIPTLEIHIAFLRKLIIEAGIAFVEIPPVPAGYNYIVCLTHDVDFVRIRNHIFDYSTIGFIYRGLVESFKLLLNSKISFFRLLKNWKAILSLPFVYFGFVNDFWFQFDHYLEIEKNLKSTYFFIPFKNRVGDKVSSQNAYLRAAKYDINNLKVLLNHLINAGNEIAVHGIDAWHNSKSGYYERKQISALVGESTGGIRIHWLLKDAQTFITLEKAGYNYDSTFGYNETVGYRGGTAQVFRPIGVKNLLELQMHIQDTALFYPHRMGLSEEAALNLCKQIINDMSMYGGVLTINWHQRSLAPERQWGDFYLRLLEELQASRPWFATASEVVEWFRKRRSVFFDEVQFYRNKLRLSFRTNETDIKPPLLIRIHLPDNQKLENKDLSTHMQNYFDLAINGFCKIEISI